MNPRTTGILFLVAVALGAFVYLYEIRGGEQRSEAEARAKRIFPELEASAVESLELRTTDGAAVRAERVDGGWRLREPVDFKGDPTALDGIADGLATLTSEGVYDEPEALEIYGLGDDASEVRFAAAGQEHRLRVGGKTPVGANHYVATATGDRVYTVASTAVNRFERAQDDLRDRRLLHFDRASLERIEVQWEGAGVELVREDGDWRLRAPLESAVDGAALDGFLSELAFLRADGFVDDPGPDDLSRLEPPAYRVVLTGKAPEEGGTAHRQELLIGGLLDESTRLARGGEASLYRIGEDRFAGLPRRVVDFRFKELTGFIAADAARFEIDFQQAGADGSSRVQEVVGELGDDGWTSEPLPMRAGAASRMIGALARLVADDIPAESMGPDELAAVGLSPPRVALRVYGAGTSETGAPALLGEVHIGVARGEHVLAKVPGRDTVYALDYAVAEDIPINLEAFENRFVSEEDEDAADEEPAAAAGDEPSAPGDAP